MMTTKGLIRIASKHCHQWHVCGAELKEGCYPVPCRYFREVVLPTYMRHIQWLHKKDWTTSKDFSNFVNAREFLMKEKKKSLEP